MIRVALAAMLIAAPASSQTWGEWQLILTYFEIGQEPVSRLYGIMVSQEACQMAGQAMAEKITAAHPATAIGVTCSERISA